MICLPCQPDEIKSKLPFKPSVPLVESLKFQIPVRMWKLSFFFLMVKSGTWVEFLKFFFLLLFFMMLMIRRGSLEIDYLDVFNAFWHVWIIFHAGVKPLVVKPSVNQPENYAFQNQSQQWLINSPFMFWTEVVKLWVSGDSASSYGSWHHHFGFFLSFSKSSG